MNYIVGLFLNYMTEEESFFALRQLMENTPYRMNKWFNQSLTMVHTSHYQVNSIKFRIHFRWKSFFKSIYPNQLLILPILVSCLQCILLRSFQNIYVMYSGLCVFFHVHSPMMWQFVFGIFSLLKDGQLCIKYLQLFLNCIRVRFEK